MFKKFFGHDDEEDEVFESVDPVLEQRRKEKFSTPLIYNDEEAILNRHMKDFYDLCDSMRVWIGLGIHP